MYDEATKYLDLVAFYNILGWEYTIEEDILFFATTPCPNYYDDVTSFNLVIKGYKGLSTSIGSADIPEPLAKHLRNKGLNSIKIEN